MSKKSKDKIWLFDLETSELAGNRGHILCAVGKWLNSPDVYTWNIYDVDGYSDPPMHKTMRNDGPMVEELVEKCAEADAVCAYYGGYNKFDVPYLNTRAMAHGLKPCPPVTVIDPYTTAKSCLRLARNNMDSVGKLLGCKMEKYHLPWDDWIKARYHAPKSMEKLLQYCINDVLVLEEIYLKLRPLIRNHPTMYIDTADGKEVKTCKVCGSSDTIKYGKRMTKCFMVHRRQCKSCGHVFDSYKSKV